MKFGRFTALALAVDSDPGTGAAKLTFTLDAMTCTGGANRTALDLVIKKP